MLDPEGLYELAPGVRVTGRPVLLHALDGFIDAAGTVRLARQHLLDMFEHQAVATFDVDQLMDYRSRRPPLLFDRDHFASYDEPELVVHLLTDAGGTPFLLLSGPEPDVQWNRLVQALAGLSDRLGVRLTVGMNAIPLAVPHTRPVGLTLHGTRRELLGAHQPWLDQVRVPGSFGNLLEYRLGQLGRDAMGVAVHIPQYLVQAEFPTAAAVLLDALAGATGLVLPTAALYEAGERAREQIDAQVAQSAEVAAVVQELETQYDATLAERATELPTGDELGAELERFLAQHRRDTGEPPES
jgi:PAC2 family